MIACGLVYLGVSLLQLIGNFLEFLLQLLLIALH